MGMRRCGSFTETGRVWSPGDNRMPGETCPGLVTRAGARKYRRRTAEHSKKEELGVKGGAGGET